MKRLLLTSAIALTLGLSLTGVMAADLPKDTTSDSYKPPVNYSPEIQVPQHRPRHLTAPYSDEMPQRPVYQEETFGFRNNYVSTYRAYQPYRMLYRAPVAYRAPVMPFLRTAPAVMSYPYFVPRGVLFGRYGHFRGRMMPVLYPIQGFGFPQIQRTQTSDSEALK